MENLVIDPDSNRPRRSSRFLPWSIASANIGRSISSSRLTGIVSEVPLCNNFHLLPVALPQDDRPKWGVAQDR